MDPNQIIGMGVDAYNALDNESKHALTYPAAKTLGLAADGLISIFCYPFLKARIFTQARLKQYQEETAVKINKIPEENRDSSKLGLVIKAIEESRYQLNEDDIRHMYVNLIASTVDNRKNVVVNPRLAMVVAQLGTKEAKLIRELYNQRSYQAASGHMTVISSENASNRVITNEAIALDPNIIHLGIEDSLNILESLGVIKLKKSTKLFHSMYEIRYKALERELKKNDFSNVPLNSHEKIVFEYDCVITTFFGRDLFHCIFE